MTAPHHSGYSAGSLSPLRQGFEASRLWQQAITIFVSIFGAVLGPLFGIIVSDYYLVKRREVALRDLYTMSPAGSLHYQNGWDRAALVALAISGAVSVGLALLGAYGVIQCRGLGRADRRSAGRDSLSRRRARVGRLDPWQSATVGAEPVTFCGRRLVVLGGLSRPPDGSVFDFGDGSCSIGNDDRVEFNDRMTLGDDVRCDLRAQRQLLSHPCCGVIANAAADVNPRPEHDVVNQGHVSEP
jgi:hypothetical protein